MQGVILSAGTAQGTILGDDGVRYTFTPLGWRHDTIRPEAGMRVDFDPRGSHAVGIYPVPGAAPTPPARPPTAPPPTASGHPGQPTQQPAAPPAPGSFPTAQPSAAPHTATGGLPPQPPPAPPSGNGGGMKLWTWALAGAGALVVLGIVGVFMLGIFPTDSETRPTEVAKLRVETPSPAPMPLIITPVVETFAPPPTTQTGTGATGRIAFHSDRDGDREIYVMNADGSDVKRLTDNSAADLWPSWSPDGQRIAFVSHRDGNAEIYVMNADGSDVKRLTDNSAYDELPAWSTEVAYLATPDVPPTPTPIPTEEVNFAGAITSTNLPSQIQVVFSLRDQRGHAIVLPAEEIERETKVFERGHGTDNNWEEIDYTETSFFVHTAENIDLEVVFALDFTNSMAEARLPNGDSGIQAMLSAFDSALAVLPSTHRIGVVEFHDRNSEPGILSVLTTDRAAIRESVTRFSNSAFDPGSSRVWDSIVAGSELFSTIQENPRAVRVLVFLSDGRDTSSTSDRDAARRFAQARKVQLYALGVGDVFQDVQLQEMAKDTDGRYYDASDISLIQEQLQLLVNDLCGQYQLSYITLRRSGDYEIRMEVEVENIPGSTDVGRFNVASFFGPDNQGVIDFDPPSLDRANNRSTLFMRALHIPRNIDRIRFKLDTSNPVEIEPVSRRNGGLLDGWPLTGPDSTGFYEVSSSQPIEFGNFGPMFKLTISGVTEQTPPDIPFEFDNSIYTDGKSLSHPAHVSVAPSKPSPWRIVFHSEREGSFEAYVMNADVRMDTRPLRMNR